MKLHESIISKDAHDYVIAHINDRPRSAVAKAAGVSISTLYRIVRENGGLIDHSRCYRHPQWWDAYIIEYFPHRASTQIAKELGTTKWRINTIARELGLKRSENFIKQQEAERRTRLKEMRAKVNYRAIAAKRLETRRRDELRAEYGLTRKTKFRYRQMPVRVYKVIWRLTSKRLYKKDKQNIYALRYDDNTLRVNEAFYTKKYGIKFKSLTQNLQQ